MFKEIVTKDDLKLLRRISEATQGNVPVESLARLAFMGGLELIVNEFLPATATFPVKFRRYRQKLTANEVTEVREVISQNWDKLTDYKIGQRFKPPISASVVQSHRHSLGLIKKRSPKVSVN